MTKTVINRLVVLMCLLISGLVATAQNAQYLIVTLQDDSKTGFALAEQPVVTCTDGILTVTSPNQTLEVTLADVKNYAFAESFSPSSAVEEIKSSTEPIIKAGMAQFENLKPGTEINIYTIEGRTAGRAVADANGSVSVDLTSLGTGVFIIVAPNASYKIINR